MLLLALVGTPACTAIWALNRGLEPEERDPRAVYAPWGAGGCAVLTLLLAFAFSATGKKTGEAAISQAEHEEELARLEEALQARGPSVRRKLPRPHVGATRPPGDDL